MPSNRGGFAQVRKVVMELMRQRRKTSGNSGFAAARRAARGEVSGRSARVLRDVGSSKFLGGPGVRKALLMEEEEETTTKKKRR